MNCLNCYDHLRTRRIFSHLEAKKTSIFSTLVEQKRKIAFCGSRKRFLSIIPLDILKRYRVYLFVWLPLWYAASLLPLFLISSCLVPLVVMGVVYRITFHFYNFYALVWIDDDETVYSNWYLLLPIFSASSNCVFPQQWEGSWFQSGVPQTIDIQGSTMSNRGSCIASDGDKFLMREWVPTKNFKIFHLI